MFWSAAVEGSLYPAQPRVLLTVLPASLRRCIPRFDRSLTTDVLTSTASSTPDPFRGIVCSSEPQLQCYDSPPESVGYARRPATAPGEDHESSSSCSGPSDVSIEMDSNGSAAAMMKYEVDSGLKWNRIVPAFNLLRNAGYEAQQPRADTRLIRSLYINGLLYLLEALPADLTREEATSIRDRLPESIAPTSPALASNSQSLTPRNKYRRYANWNNSPEPSYLHRALAYSIIQLFLIIQLLSPYIRIFLQQVYQYERSHRITERVVAVTLEAADSLGKGGVTLGSAVLGFKEGKLGAAVSDIAAWWIEGVTGGICEGVGEGLIILGATRVQTDTMGVGKESNHQSEGSFRSVK